MRMSIGLSVILCVHAVVRGGESAGASGPRVWIFAGLAGDAAHERIFRTYVDELRATLTTRFNVESGSCRVLFGKGTDAEGACTRENLAGELAAIVEHSRTLQPAWAFFLGHADTLSGEVGFNLPGADLHAAELGRLLAAAPPGAPLALFFTMPSSSPFLAACAAPGRVVVSATAEPAELNETVFPRALIDTLKETPVRSAPLRVCDIFSAATLRVKAHFARRGLLQTEHALLDGDGDGKGAEEPAPADVLGARRFALEFRVPRRPADVAPEPSPPTVPKGVPRV